MSAKNEWEYYKLRQELNALKAKQRGRNARIKAAGYLPNKDMLTGYTITAKYAPLPSRAQFRGLPEAEQQAAIRSIQGQIKHKKFNLDRPTSTLSGIKEAHARLLNQQLKRGDITARNLNSFVNSDMKDMFNRNRGINNTGYDIFIKAQRLFDSIDTDSRFKDWDPDKRERFKQYLRKNLDPTKDDYNPDFLIEQDPDKVKSKIDLYIAEFESLENLTNPGQLSL